jgi:hypothetical protein
MTLEERIDADYKTAFKAHEAVKVGALRMVKSAIKNAAIEARQTLTDEETLAVIAREVKRRRESIAMFTQGGRTDLVEQEQAELATIEGYLPAQMGDEELTKIVAAVVAELAAGPKDFGKVMNAAMAKVKGQADGNRVSAIVKKLLTPT